MEPGQSSGGYSVGATQHGVGVGSAAVATGGACSYYAGRAPRMSGGGSGEGGGSRRWLSDGQADDATAGSAEDQLVGVPGDGQGGRAQAAGLSAFQVSIGPLRQVHKGLALCKCGVDLAACGACGAGWAQTGMKEGDIGASAGAASVTSAAGANAGAAAGAGAVPSRAAGGNQVVEVADPDVAEVVLPAGVLLRPEDIAALRQRAPSLSVLHTYARILIDSIAGTGAALGGPHGVVELDGPYVWQNWREYVATHPQAEALVGPGIVSVTAEFIEGTKDSNRYGEKRLDFVLRHSNGDYWRLHPGKSRGNDAKPRFITARPTGALRAANEWVAFPAVGMFTFADFQRIPPHDRLGKRQVWRILGELPVERPFDLTDGTHLKWWLWVGNLGRESREVIGEGVVGAWAMRSTETSHTVEFQRIPRGDMAAAGAAWVSVVLEEAGNGILVRVVRRVS